MYHYVENVKLKGNRKRDPEHLKIILKQSLNNDDKRCFGIVDNLKIHDDRDFMDSGINTRNTIDSGNLQNSINLDMDHSNDSVKQNIQPNKYACMRCDMLIIDSFIFLIRKFNYFY